MTRHRPCYVLVLLCALLIALSVSPARAIFYNMRSFTTAYADGAYPVGAQALSGGYLYGFTQQGTTGYGSFYKQTVAGAVTTLNNFTGVAPNVYYPNAGPVVGASPSTMYATCMYGGTGGIGMVFSISTGGVVTDLHSFTGGTTDGSTPYGG